MITLIIPVWNEKWRVGPTLIEIRSFIQRRPGVISEVLVVDDFSTDNTIERITTYSSGQQYGQVYVMQKMMQ